MVVASEPIIVVEEPRLDEARGGRSQAIASRARTALLRARDGVARAGRTAGGATRARIASKPFVALGVALVVGVAAGRLLRFALSKRRS